MKIFVVKVNNCKYIDEIAILFIRAFCFHFIHSALSTYHEVHSLYKILQRRHPNFYLFFLWRWGMEELVQLLYYRSFIISQEFRTLKIYRACTTRWHVVQRITWGNESSTPYYESHALSLLLNLPIIITFLIHGMRLWPLHFRKRFNSLMYILNTYVVH